MNRLYYFLGAIIPIPLFFDLSSLSFILHRASFGGDWYIAHSGQPVPFGIFAFLAITFFLFSFRIGKKNYISVEILALGFFLMFFAILSILQLNIVRTLALLFPFFCMYFVVALTKNIGAYKKVGSGYIISFIFFILLHFFSVIFFIIVGAREWLILFNSVFGILIYQALVSYSAVLSYTAGTLLIYATYKSYFSQKVPIFIFIFIVLFLLYLGSRKAVLLDIGILFSLFLFYAFIKFIYKLKIEKNIIILPLFAILGYVILPFENLYNREVSLKAVTSQRGEAYNVFFNSMANSDLTQILLGHGGGWGGFSNIYIEMIYRLGILGFLLYFIAFFIGLVIVRRKIKYLFNFDRRDNYFSLWLWFTILTAVLSNVFNMNLQLPYYSMNLTMIMMVFLYHTKTISTQR
jgi:hypothetical protein